MSNSKNSSDHKKYNEFDNRNFNISKTVCSEDGQYYVKSDEILALENMILNIKRRVF